MKKNLKNLKSDF